MEEHERPGEVPVKRSAALLTATNLAVVEESAAASEVLALYEAFRVGFGRQEVPGIAKCFATHPVMLRSMMDLAGGLLFVEGHLMRRHKEMVATLVSAQNTCAYCAASHGNALLAQGGSPEVLDALRQGDLNSHGLSPQERALLQFALQVNGEHSSMTREDIERTMHAGWTEMQMSETVHVAALFAAFNRIANAFGLPAGC